MRRPGERDRRDSDRAPILLWWVVLLVLLSPRGAGGQESPLWRGLEAGEHEVGFERIWTRDRSRPWPRSPYLDSLEGPVSRPIRIDLWYPGRCAGGERLTLKAYFEMTAPGAAFEDLVFLTSRWDEYSARGLAPDSAAFDELMATETVACSDADRAPGRFPLVVYSAGWYNRVPDNAILAEYLASHGFVVVTVPQLNPGLWTFSFESDRRSVENQVRDLEVALGTAIRREIVDRRRIAAAGYSTGGDVALLLQARNPLVDAVVGLDPSWALTSENDVVAASSFEPADRTVPICVLRRAPEDPGADSILHSLTGAPRLVGQPPGATHGTFSDDPRQKWIVGAAPESAVRAHGKIVRATRECLSAALRPGERSFDGAGVGARLRSLGLTVRWLPPESGGDEP